MQKSPPTAAMTSILQDTREFLQEAVEAHNKYRAIHGVAPLKINPEMCIIAKAWVENIALRNKMEHSQAQDRVYRGQTLGENIAMKFDSRGGEITGKQS